MKVREDLVQASGDRISGCQASMQGVGAATVLRYDAAPAGQGSPVCLCGITQRGGPVGCWAPSCFRRFWAQVTTLALAGNCSLCQELGKNRSLIWSGNFS